MSQITAVLNSEKFTRRYFFILFLVIYSLSIFIFFLQANTSGGRYTSDLIYHIQASQDSYSIVTIFFGVLKIFPLYTLWIAMFLALLCASLPYAIAYFLRYINNSISNFAVISISTMLTFVAPIYIPYFHTHRYIGLLSPTAYHNSTYTAVKLLSIFALVCFYRIYFDYKTNINSRYLFLFSLILLLTTFAKPSFTVSFLIVMLVILIVNFIKDTKLFFNSMLFGIATLPSVFLLFYQKYILYEKIESTGVSLGYLELLSHYNQHPIIGLIQSLIFVFLVLAYNYKDLIKDKIYLFSWSMFAVAMFQFLFLIENGSRKLHGNFGWGAMLFLFILFIVSASKLYDNLKSIDLKSNEYFKFGYLVITLFVLIIHFYCGLEFFLVALSGGRFW